MLIALKRLKNHLVELLVCTVTSSF